MNTARPTFAPHNVETSLSQIRGNAPRGSANVRALAAYSRHTDCPLAGLGFAASVDFNRLLRGTRYQAPFGQSPFAFARGNQFEERLRDRNYHAVLELLAAEARRPLVNPRTVNLRDGFASGRAGMEQRSQRTLTLLGEILRREPSAPHLIDGAVLRGWVGGVLSYFEADAVAASLGDDIRVAEVKSFPKVDERVDPHRLAEALDQVAVYVLLARQEVERLCPGSSARVSERAMLITPRNVSLTPTLSVVRVEQRVRRIGQLLDSVAPFADTVAAYVRDVSFAVVGDTAVEESRRVEALHQIADRVTTTYKPDCLSTCGNALFCRERAFNQGSLCLTGHAAARLIPGVGTLQRAAALSRGSLPTSAEEPAAALLAAAGQLYDSLHDGAAAQIAKGGTT